MTWSEAEGARRAREVFARELGGAPEGVWSAPGRVNLIGEHTDYNSGLALPIALPHRTFAALRRREDGRIRVVSAQRPGEPIEAMLAELAPPSTFGWAGYVLGVAWSLREAGLLSAGFDLALDSCVPVGAGLSSSAALECAMAVGLAGHAPTDVLIPACVRAENDFVGAPTGAMDQTVSLRAQAGHALLIDFADGSLEQIPFTAELLVIDTRAEHALADGEYARRRAECARAAELAGVATLRELTTVPADPVLAARARHVASENARVLEFAAELRGPAPALPRLGALLNASHDSLRDDFEVSCRELDVAVDAARAAGAYGARMTGGGFGGSAIALVEPGAAAVVRAEVAEAFRRAGLGAPTFSTAVASSGALTE
ncbi:galactokinase [Tomitella biformata]|uniref:galactokinase n=1 Tax=Tomitella biformata TaxID=630403 RepID=UPI0004634C05|nr:galactokinase [Tomitella biformata]